MKINRSNIAAILGVSFSKNFDIEEMQQALTSAIPALQQAQPKLFSILSNVMPIVTQLVQQEQTIKQNAQIIQDLEQKIEIAEKVFKKVVAVYEKKNQQVVMTIGVTGGAQPPYPQAGPETIPLIAAVSTAEENLNTLKDSLTEKATQLNTLAEAHKRAVESVGESITNSVESTSSMKYDTNVEQFIYT